MKVLAFVMIAAVIVWLLVWLDHYLGQPLLDDEARREAEADYTWKGPLL